MLRSLTLLWQRLVRLYTKDIWQPACIADKSPRGWAYAALRVISITITGILATRAFARAAALSFTTILSIGPLIALAVFVAGFRLTENDIDVIANKINDMVRFIAPQVDQYESIRQNNRRERHAQSGNAAQSQTTAQPQIAPSSNVSSENATPSGISERKPRPEIVRLINTFTTSARSGTVGGISAISLIIIVIFLFSAIEDVFNDIWGVRRTRSWLTRVVFYWTIVTLSVVVLSAIGTLSAAAFIQSFQEKLPFGEQLIGFAQFLMPAIAVLLIIGMLTLFYRFTPNTRVNWSAALFGAITMAVLLVGNNLIAFTYFRRIEITQSLYGPLGVLPVLMLGLYIFWFIVLVGGQVSYAVQNVHFRNSQIAWSALSHSTRERLTLIVLLTITRRFQACMPPCTVAELGDSIKAPTQILNESLNRLIDLKLISPIPPPARGEASAEYLYQPARPLNRMSLGEFKEKFEDLGEDPAGTTIDRLDPIAARYHAAVDALNKEELFAMSLERLFDQSPFASTVLPVTDKITSDKPAASSTAQNN